jgi:hypothetical protein
MVLKVYSIWLNFFPQFEPKNLRKFWGKKISKVFPLFQNGKKKKKNPSRKII